MKHLRTNHIYFSTMFIFIITLLIGIVLGNKFIGIFLCIVPVFLTLNSVYAGLGMLLLFVPLRPFILTYNSGFSLLADFIIITLVVITILNNRKKIGSFHFFELAFFTYVFIGVVAGFLGNVYVVAIMMQARAMVIFFLLYIVTKKTPTFNRYIPLYCWTSIAVGLFISIQGLIEKLSHRTLFIPKQWQEMILSATNKDRIYGLLKGPNELAVYMIILVFVAYYLYKRASSRFEKRSLFFIMSLFFSIFMLTQSRGSFLAVILFVPIAMILYKRKFPYRTFITVFLLSVTLTFCIEVTASSTSLLHTKRFTHSFSDEQLEHSLQDGRLYYIQRGIEAFMDKPLFGHGFGSFGDSGSKSYKSPIVDKYELNPTFYSDNQYIQVLAETGIVGAISFILFLIGMGLIVWKRRENALLVFLYIAGLFLGIIYNIWEMDVFALYYFGLLGLESQHYPYKNIFPYVQR